MQKKLIALAVAGMFAVPAAFAATSNVDIYGKFHASVNVYGGDYDDNAINNVGISNNASRIGFKGSEDLGGGLSAIWQVETSVNLDEGGGAAGSGRNTFIGLASKSMGTLTLGKQDTPLKLVGRSVDLFGDTIADSRNVLGGGSDTRTDNTVMYVSPDFSGFSLAAAYMTDPNVGSTAGPVTSTNAADREDSSAYNLSAAYSNGPIYVGLGYGDGDALENSGIDDHWRVAGAFTMGDLKFVAQYDKINREAANSDFDAWMLGAQYKMGNIVLKANYMDGNQDGTGTVDPKQWTVGADYLLSKRTTVYALYANGENIALGAGAGINDQVGPEAGKEDISAFSVGVVHSF